LYSSSLFVLLLVILICCASLIGCCCFDMKSRDLAFIEVDGSFEILRFTMSMCIMKLFYLEIQGIWLLEHLNSCYTCISLSINSLCNSQYTKTPLGLMLSTPYSSVAIGLVWLCQSTHLCSFLPASVSKFHRYDFGLLQEYHC